MKLTKFKPIEVTESRMCKGGKGVKPEYFPSEPPKAQNKEKK